MSDRRHPRTDPDQDTRAASPSFPPRRRALGAAAALLAPALLPTMAAAKPTATGRALRQASALPPIKPPRLRAGDTIGLLSPAGATNEDEISAAVARIEGLGFRARLSPNLRATFGIYGGTPAQRASDLHAMFADPSVHALWCIRGGSGAIGLLNLLDYRLIRRHPKILVGMSDITALQLALLAKSGLVTFHGPVALASNTAFSTDHLLSLLMDPQSSRTLPISEANRARSATAAHFAPHTFVAGQASGRLVGGNLSLMAALCGTPYAADYRDAILFVEDVGEDPYRIDRWMTQLDLAGGLHLAAAVVAGVFDHCIPHDTRPALSLHETLSLHLGKLAVPAVSGYSFGHIGDQVTLPLGIRARLDTEHQTITLLEPAVA